MNRQTSFRSNNAGIWGVRYPMTMPNDPNASSFPGPIRQGRLNAGADVAPSFLRRNAVGFGAVLLAVAVIVTLQLVRSPAPTPHVFAAATPLATALDDAESAGKPVFVVATADWCPPCQAYKRGALADPAVADLLGEHTIPVILDADIDRAEVMQLGVERLPSTFLIREGEVVAGMVGAPPSARLIAWLSENGVSPN